MGELVRCPGGMLTFKLKRACSRPDMASEAFVGTSNQDDWAKYVPLIRVLPAMEL